MAILELETAIPGTDPSGSGHRKIWDTKQVRERESFSYYREGPCQALFALTPRAGDQDDFAGRIEQVPTRRGAITYLEHVPHSVRRSARDAHAIGDRYLHLNYQISGTNQYDFNGSLAARQPGSIIAFQSTCPFTLQMNRSRTNSLVSLLIPEADLAGPLTGTGPACINPVYDTPIRTLFFNARPST